MVKAWQLLRREMAVDDDWLKVYRDTVLTGSGVQIEGYYTVSKRDFALVVPITTAGDLVLIREYKHAVGAVVYSLPAGIVDEGEDAATAAARELGEETGYVATDLLPLGTWCISDAFVADRGHLFLARGAYLAGAARLEASEEIEVELMPFAEAVRQVQAGVLFAGLAAVAAVLLAAGSS